MKDTVNEWIGQKMETEDSTTVVKDKLKEFTDALNRPSSVAQAMLVLGMSMGQAPDKRSKTRDPRDTRTKRRVKWVRRRGSLNMDEQR